MYFCCKGCIPKYQKDPAKYAAKVAAQRRALADRAKVQVICPVLKKPVDQKVFIESNGKKVYFCCKGCVGKYQGNPAKYAAALANSYSYQTTCPVMGGKIDPKVSTTLSTGETIYYCCPGCDKPLRGNPAKYNKNLAAQAPGTSNPACGRHPSVASWSNLRPRCGFRKFWPPLFRKLWPLLGL